MVSECPPGFVESTRLLTFKLPAYFENCYDGIFGIVHRPSFEARLRTHFASPQTNQDGEEDAAWYALRNIVYAGGCRCVLGQSSSTTFVEAQEEAFRFFQNALSVFTELTFAYTGLTAVRALTLMVSPLICLHSLDYA